MPKAPNTKVNWPPKTADMSPAPRPTAVTVGFYELAIKWIPDDKWVKPEGIDPSACGQFDADRGHILMRVTPDTHEQMLRETLWHEILHACWWHMGLSDYPVVKDDAQEEEIVKRITHASLHVIQENPGVMAYISAGLYRKKVWG